MSSNLLSLPCRSRPPRRSWSATWCTKRAFHGLLLDYSATNSYDQTLCQLLAHKTVLSNDTCSTTSFLPVSKVREELDRLQVALENVVWFYFCGWNYCQHISLRFCDLFLNWDHCFDCFQVGEIILYEKFNKIWTSRVKDNFNWHWTFAG